MNFLLYLFQLYGVALAAMFICEFLFATQQDEIALSNEFLGGQLPKNLLVYNEENRFGIFTLLYLYFCMMITGPISVATSICLIAAWITTNLIGIIIDLLSFNYFIKHSSKGETTYQKERKTLRISDSESRNQLVNQVLLQLESIGIQRNSATGFMILKKIIIFLFQLTVYALTLVPRQLLNLVNIIDRNCFSREVINQDLYWLLINTGNEEIKDFNKGLTTPLRLAIAQLNIRALKALANDPSTEINEIKNKRTLLEDALDADFKPGIDVILKHSEYKLYTEKSDLLRIGKMAIKKRNKMVLKHILKNIYDPLILDDLLNKALQTSFNEAKEMIFKHPIFKLSEGDNQLTLAKSAIIGKDIVALADIVKNINEQAPLRELLGDSINNRFSKGVEFLTNRLFIENGCQVEFLIPYLTSANYEVLKDVIRSMDYDSKKRLRDVHMEEIEDKKRVNIHRLAMKASIIKNLNKLQRSGVDIYEDLSSATKDSNEDLKEMMYRIQYLKLMHEIDYASLANATGLASSDEFKKLYKSKNMQEKMRDYNCECPLSLSNIQVPIQIETLAWRPKLQIEKKTWQHDLYEYDDFLEYLKTEKENVRVDYPISVCESPMSRDPITNIKLAVEEYSGALILAFLAMTIDFNLTILAKEDIDMDEKQALRTNDKRIQHIEKQKDITLSKENVEKMRELIHGYRETRKDAAESSTSLGFFVQPPKSFQRRPKEF
ncbi:MAG: hypothetical protein VX737_01095 [Pseudomonadota bacterium]|nr:hypothetical protein [Pseudomonadota bacterium]